MFELPMFKLSSGRMVGICSERARMHAIHLQKHVSRVTPHEDLYDLVDIITPASASSAGIPGRPFRFNGSTLSDQTIFQTWPQTDREAFFAWLQEGRQCYEIEGARRKLLYDTLPQQIIVHAYPALLYSGLKKRIQSLALEKAPISQWQQTIHNFKQQGVRQAEIKWSGIMAYLSQLQEQGVTTISKQELLGQISFSHIRMELKNEQFKRDDCSVKFDECAKYLSGAELARAGLKLEQGERVVLRYINQCLNYKIGYVKKIASKSVIGELRWFALDPHGCAINPYSPKDFPFFNTVTAAIDVAKRHSNANYNQFTHVKYSEKYKHVSLFGGDDYREWLLTIPDYHASYFSSHFTERNVLLHVRTKTRYDKDKRKILFIEEIQSDWHQTRYKKSINHFDVQAPLAPFQNEWIGLALKLMLMHAVESGYEGLAWVDGETHMRHYHHQCHSVQRLYDRQLPGCLCSLGKKWGCVIASTHIDSKQPGLRLSRSKGKWQVTDGTKHFQTLARFSKEEGQAIIARHSKSVLLDVPVFWIPPAMAEEIKQIGLPLFGEVLL